MRALFFAIAVVATIFGVAAVLTASPSRAADCDSIVRFHGYLTQASRECGFSEALNVSRKAKVCLARSEAMEESHREGIRFAKGEASVEGVGWCGVVAARYPRSIAAR